MKDELNGLIPDDDNVLKEAEEINCSAAQAEQLRNPLFIALREVQALTLPLKIAQCRASLASPEQLQEFKEALAFLENQIQETAAQLGRSE